MTCAFSHPCSLMVLAPPLGSYHAALRSGNDAAISGIGWFHHIMPRDQDVDRPLPANVACHAYGKGAGRVPCQKLKSTHMYIELVTATEQNPTKSGGLFVLRPTHVWWNAKPYPPFETLLERRSQPVSQAKQSKPSYPTDATNLPT